MPRRHAALLLLALTLPACAHGRPGGTTRGALDLHHVVLYRSGVAYFERTGTLDGDTLRLAIRRDQINDVLKSLTVVERGSGRAVSVSLPLDPEAWASAALASLRPGAGNLARVLDGLRGADVVLHTRRGRVAGRIVMVEKIRDEPDPDQGKNASGTVLVERTRDHRVTLLRGDRMVVTRLSKVTGITLRNRELAMHLHRRLDAAAGEGMFERIEIELRLTGARSHDLLVSYVVGAPMWRPTYRVVLPEGGKGTALLQGWAVVDNISGEDWNGVTMALTAGEPIAFRYDLHTPQHVPRTDLTPAGRRRRAAVALGETSWDEAPAGAGVPEAPGKMAPMEEDAALIEDEAGVDAMPSPSRSGGGGSAVSTRTLERRARPKSKRRAGALADVPAPEPPRLDADSLARSLQVKARAKQVSGLTRYDLGDPVTVPNGTATLVAILNAKVQAEETFLFRPGGSGPGYEQNPYRVVRFKNSTPFALEPGPISIYAGGSFVGEGMSETVSTGTSATIPFAVEPSILVTSRTQHSGDEMKLIRIVRGVMEVESFARTTTTWDARAQHENGFRLLIRHTKAGSNYDIVDPPKGTERLPDAYLVPIQVPKGKRTGTVTVTEQTPSRTTLSIWNARAPKLLERLLVGGELTAAQRKLLQPVVDLRLQIGRIDSEIDGLRRQVRELDQRAEAPQRQQHADEHQPDRHHRPRRQVQRGVRRLRDVDVDLGIAQREVLDEVQRQLPVAELRQVDADAGGEDALTDTPLAAADGDGQTRPAPRALLRARLVDGLVGPLTWRVRHQLQHLVAGWLLRRTGGRGASFRIAHCPTFTTGRRRSATGGL